MGEAITETRNIGSKFAGMIGHMRWKDEQRDQVMLWAGIAIWVFLALGLAGSPFLAS
jgi:hypothetical protein